MAHAARIIEIGGAVRVAAVVRILASGANEVVARLEGDADAAFPKAHVMAEALDGKFSFHLNDWRKGEGDDTFDSLSEMARTPHFANLEASSTGCSMSVRPDGHMGDPNDECVSVTMERNAGALWIGIGPEGADSSVNVLVGPKGVLLHPSTGDHGLLVLSANEKNPLLNRVEHVRCVDDSYARMAIGTEIRPEDAAHAMGAGTPDIPSGP